MPSRTLPGAEAMFDCAGVGDGSHTASGDAAMLQVTPPGVTGRAGAPSTGVRHTKGMKP